MKQLSWLAACLCVLGASAQDRLVLMGKAPALYVSYTVGAETSLKNISNQFGQSVTKLASYNGITLNALLHKGAQVKIPVTEYNLLRTKSDGANAPVYHIVEKGDNLYRLSKNNNITLANLREWNELKSDAIRLGQPVIIGFMANVKAGEFRAAEPKKEDPKKTTEETTVAKTEPKPETKTAIKKEEPKTQPEEPAAKPEIKNQPAKEPLKIPAETPVSAPEKKIVPAPATAAEYLPKDGDEGYFAAVYAGHGKDKSQQFHSGDAATFKTISGWADRKYYVLINDVAPETIVRITAPNNRSICAKVLGPLQETKGGNGLLLRISNSAASTLGISDPKFTVTVTYFE